jgi:putative transposase
MKRNRFSEEQIIGILKEHEAGVSVVDLCRKHGVSDASIAAVFHPPSTNSSKLNCMKTGVRTPDSRALSWNHHA